MAKKKTIPDESTLDGVPFSKEVLAGLFIGIFFVIGAVWTIVTAVDCIHDSAVEFVHNHSKTVVDSALQELRYGYGTWSYEKHCYVDGDTGIVTCRNDWRKEEK